MLLWLVAVVLLLALWRRPLWRPRGLPGVASSPPRLIGHRGVRGSLPENTSLAFRAAFEAGLDGIECDVQRTSDGHLVLYHDALLGDRRLPEISFADLREQVPDLATLEELLELARDHPGKLLNLEVKTDRLRTVGLERALVRAVRRSGLTDRVLVSSFNPWSLVKIRLLGPELRIAVLEDSAPGARVRWLAGWLHADAFHPDASLVDGALVSWARRRALPLNAWTVNRPERVRELLELGVDGIMGDDPAALLRAAGRGRSDRLESAGG